MIATLAALCLVSTPLTVSVVLDTSVIESIHGQQKASDYTAYIMGHVTTRFKQDANIDVRLQSVITKHLSEHEHPVGVLLDVQFYRAMQPTSDVTIYLTTRNLRQGETFYRGYASDGQAGALAGAAVVALMFSHTDEDAIAHEIAHTLGVPHDGNGACAREVPSGFLMSATQIAPSFSACSVRVIQAYRYKMTTDPECKAKSVRR